MSWSKKIKPITFFQYLSILSMNMKKYLAHFVENYMVKVTWNDISGSNIQTTQTRKISVIFVQKVFFRKELWKITSILTLVINLLCVVIAELHLKIIQLWECIEELYIWVWNVQKRNKLKLKNFQTHWILHWKMRKLNE